MSVEVYASGHAGFSKQSSSLPLNRLPSESGEGGIAVTKGFALEKRFLTRSLSWQSTTLRLAYRAGLAKVDASWNLLVTEVRTAQAHAVVPLIFRA
ncbi:hypothetical protein [Phyllobacterium endophyticum]|uniref:Uncharacterized protein n=1 Tax=Phyllobacterium endophyticum TaxID=1149773 RepID=A0A2P7AR49_9HYPH|nr:hypothetical protein [Phyllobacterium endophyticum]MBB3237332.1 hypothetical protein [Phyllobacterium endophyticum]PSH56692.1 hypothetical protein CU100_15160 [Phyllobacterium endophyticum]TYR44320.1 hypothetical protein FY050_04040 [Phyllobacterium endophyticum]